MANYLMLAIYFIVICKRLHKFHKLFYDFTVVLVKLSRFRRS